MVACVNYQHHLISPGTPTCGLPFASWRLLTCLTATLASAAFKKCARGVSRRREILRNAMAKRREEYRIWVHIFIQVNTQVAIAIDTHRSRGNTGSCCSLVLHRLATHLGHRQECSMKSLLPPAKQGCLQIEGMVHTC